MPAKHLALTVLVAVLHAPASAHAHDHMDAHLRAGRTRVERFFGGPFARRFEIVVLRSRAEMDAYFKRRWGMEATERWMVAAGVSDTLVILSPDRWALEAVDHDGSDPAHVREIVAHELVHVYHGQNNPSHEFEGMDDLGWFVEGLATYVSGQLTSGHRNAAAEAISAGKAPTKLAAAWSGKYRYGVCGSLVAYIDHRFGRDTIRRLLPATKPEEALRTIGLSEQELLTGWRERVTIKDSQVRTPAVGPWD